MNINEINNLIQEKLNKVKELPEYDAPKYKYRNQLPFKVGDKVHVKSEPGIFTVCRFTKNFFVITCNVWKKKFESGQMESPYKYKRFDDYIKRAGGLHN